MNTEGVPLLEENEFETEGSGNSVGLDEYIQKQNPGQLLLIPSIQVSGDTASAYSESSTKSR